MLDPLQQAALAVDDAFGASGAARGIEHDGGGIDRDDIGKWWRGRPRMRRRDAGGHIDPPDLLRQAGVAGLAGADDR